MNHLQKVRLKIILTGALVTGTGIGIFSNCAGLFIGPVCRELGFSRGAFTMIGTISIIGSMSVLLWFGKLLQTIPLKRLLLTCATVCALVPMGYSFCEKIWQFYLFAALNGLAINGLTMLTIGALIERKLVGDRGMVVGASFAGVGIFSSVMLPVLQFVISRYGWRWAYRVESIVGLSVLMVTILLLVETNSQSGTRVDAAQCEGIPYAEAVRTKSFRFLFAGLFCANFVNLALFNHAIPFLTDSGFSPMQAATITSMATLLMIATKPLYGLALDRMGLYRGAFLLGGVLLACAIMALTFIRWLNYGYLYAALLAGCACANALPANIHAAKLFGKKDYVRIVALLTMASSAGAAISTPLAGFIFDKFGSYHIIWIGCVLLSICTTLLIILSLKTRVIIKFYQ